MEGLVEGGVRGLALSLDRLRGRSDEKLAVSVEVEEMLLVAVGERDSRLMDEPGHTERPSLLRSRCWLWLSINLRSAPGDRGQGKMPGQPPMQCTKVAK